MLDKTHGHISLIFIFVSMQNHTVLDLKTMISDYTKLEDNIGDIGKRASSVHSRRDVASANGEGGQLAAIANYH